jgi:hypothetical protein
MTTIFFALICIWCLFAVLLSLINQSRTIKSSAKPGKLNKRMVRHIVKNIAKLRNKANDPV